MKKYILLFFSLLVISPLFTRDIKLTESSNQFKIVSNSTSEFTFVNYLSNISFKRIKKDNQRFVKILVDGYGENANSGEAELPALEELIDVPIDSDILIEIINKEEKLVSLSDYNLSAPIFPSQPSILKSQNIEDVPFYHNTDYYSFDGFYKNDIVKTEFLGVMRGRRLARLSINPFSYNPVTNEINVVTKLEVKISFQNYDQVKDNHNKQKYFSPEFEKLFKTCINYKSDSYKDVITTYPVKYVIISDPMFQTAIQPLVEWKTRKGFEVIEGYTNDPMVGNTTSSIHAFIKSMYDNATLTNPPPTYLLIVGDDAQVPSFSGLTGSHLSDMYYCEFDGNGDFYPEMYYGRFSATTAGEVEAQVSKTLSHEQYTFSDPSFLDDIVLVAGVDASMAPTYGNGQINYGTDNYFNLNAGLNVHTYLYGSGTPITSDQPAASAAIISDISNGSSFANYTAHCGSSGWGDPSFVVSDINGLQNYDKFGVLIGNCCQSNKFDVPECFGEAILRASNKGAVGYIGGSNNTYWDEDYWWAVGNTSNFTSNPTYAGTGLAVYDCLMHENGEQEEDWFITTGQMIHSGNLAVTQAGGSEHYYWEIYHVMGDPSLMPYIGVPTSLNVSHSSVIPVGTSTVDVNAEEHSYVAISMNGILLDAQIVGSSGLVSLNFNAINNVGIADIVVTKQFRQPYQGTIQVISPTGPYVIYSSSDINDNTGNNNQQVDYDEFISLNVDIENVGSIDASMVNVSISTNDPFISLINSSDIVNVVPSQQVISINNPFTFQVANNVPDQHSVVFDLDITDNLGNAWNSYINLSINAPKLEHISYYIDDAILGNGNGRLDAGESADLVVEVTNIGHSNIGAVISSISCLSPYITINNTSSSLSSINVNTSQYVIFNITTNSNTPVGTYVEFQFDLNNGSYFYNNILSEIIGIIDEDYETGDLTQYAWDNDVDYPWYIDNVNVYEGVSSCKSGDNLPDNAVSNLKLNIDVIAPGDISFFKFVSSEQDYDFLQFYIDGNKQGEWSGIDNSWSYVSFPVSVGYHELEWEYDKDGGWEDGEDCAWIDYIVFPPINIGQSTYIIDKDFKFDFFPNPTKGVFSLIFNDRDYHDVKIYDQEGKLILEINQQNERAKIDLTNFSSGTYTVKVLPELVNYKIIKY